MNAPQYRTLARVTWRFDGWAEGATKRRYVALRTAVTIARRVAARGGEVTVEQLTVPTESLPWRTVKVDTSRPARLRTRATDGEA
jgi:hypothetical protein